MEPRTGTAALVLGLALAQLPVACTSGPRTVPSTDDGRPPDSVTFVIDNRNYLDVNVRLFSDGRQVSRHFVVGNTVDTVRLPRERFLGTRWFHAVLSPVGSRRDYALPRELFPEDASIVLIDVSEHLP